MQLSPKQKTFSRFSVRFGNLDSILNLFKKKMTLIADYLLSYGLRKTWLDKCIKSPNSEDTSKSNMVNRLKHC